MCKLHSLYAAARVLRGIIVKQILFFSDRPDEMYNYKEENREW